MEESKFKTIWRWYFQTSAVIGLPIVLCLLIVGITRMGYTVTCEIFGAGCQYSLIRTEVTRQAIETLADTYMLEEYPSKKRK